MNIFVRERFEEYLRCLILLIIIIILLGFCEKIDDKYKFYFFKCIETWLSCG